MSLFSRLAGIIGNIFQIDVTNAGPKLKNTSGNLDVRNSADAAYTNVRVADPVIAADAATKAYVDSQIDAGAVREIRFDVGIAATTSSATSIPANAIITEALLDV